MPGMGRALQSNNPTIVSAFHTALLHQLLVVLVIGALLAVALNVIRTVQYRRLRAVGRSSFPTDVRWEYAEPPARRILRIGFGILWVFDGLLQVQSSMPLGLPSSVIQPAASTSPSWVQHVVNSGLNIWSLHPVGAAAATVWIQVGLGLWLLVAPRGLWSRAGGLAGAGWGLVVWVFGEAFGGIFAPGLTWLFGAPGAVLLYCAGGLLVALPDRAYATPRLGRLVTTLSGIFFIGMALLQAWPGRGFWQGRLHGGTDVGTLTGMVTQMAKTPQPAFLRSWVSSFGSFDAVHGWAVNLVVVALIAAIGVALCTGRQRVVGPAVLAAVVLCLADWVLVEDLGFLGGTGTDVNNMAPTALLLVAGYVAMVRLPSPIAAFAPGAAFVPDAEGVAAVGPGGAVGDEGPTTRRWWESVSPRYLVGIVAAVGATAMVAVGVAPMALAAANPNADPIVSQALNGTPNVIDAPAPAFSLVNQRGTRVSLSSLRGHTLALTFLDPVCTSDCPLIAQEFRQTDERLGADNAQVDFVAIVANPIYRSTAFTQAFDREEGLSHVGNWLYLTGSVAALRQVWNSYGVLVETAGSGAMIAHSDLAFVIDAQGNERAELEDDPGDGSTASTSSFSSLLLDRIDLVLHS
jgi:cytochrome oxidase Cu insertion factor (SCO1/SenC/PrrC family)